MATRKPRSNGNSKAVTELKEIEMIVSSHNVNQGFETILDTEPDLTIEESLKLTGALHRMDLLERLQVLLPDIDLIDWHTIPVAFKSQLEEIQRLIDSQDSVRKLGLESSAQQFQAPEIPLIDELIPQTRSSTLAPSDPGQLAQGHHEQLQERLNLEAYAKEAEQGVRELAIETALQKVDNISEDIKNAVLQRVAQKKAELFEEIGESLLVEFMNETNSQLPAPTAYADVEKRNQVCKPDFLKRYQSAKSAWKNRENLSQPAT